MCVFVDNRRCDGGGNTVQAIGGVSGTDVEIQ